MLDTGRVGGGQREIPSVVMMPDMFRVHDDTAAGDWILDPEWKFGITDQLDQPVTRETQ